MSNPLQLHDVTKNFGDNTVLSGITLSINPGETVAVMGPSGSGKSTLLHCMSGVLVPTHGKVDYGETCLSSLNDDSRSSLRLNHFGFVFQDGQLLPELTALDNVALPAMLTGVPRYEAHQHAFNLLRQLGLEKFTKRRPGKLSGGQAQRVAIARALVTEPGIIFADEPTGALDQTTGQEVMQMLTTLVKQSGSTLVVVTHDSNVANWLDRRVEIRDGIVHDDRLLRGVR
ncbi:ABC transporter ATP-binding protein [Corynebacterium lubricantis]|uniref:ABC transporter ATP-binding protein n=1 Tax=Corynebacterium lubricantis TaxID=541095 RepID=UPI000363B0A1|nr:ABC transporter ATP-binding protein [Corynebacterium lubricantis]